MDATLTQLVQEIVDLNVKLQQKDAENTALRAALEKK